MTTNNSTWPWTWPITWSSGTPVTAETHHVDAIFDLLQQAEDFGLWTTTPEIYKYWTHSQSERGPGAGMPPYLYLWSPTTSTLDRFSVDTDDYLRQDTLIVQQWSLNETEARQLQSDTARVLSQFLDDNSVNTPYTDVQPVGLDDWREQKPARTTEHYVMGVELETTELDPSGKT